MIIKPKRRIKFIMQFEVDLDMVPGSFHEPDDWVFFVQRDFMRQVHYNARCQLTGAPIMVPPLSRNMQHPISSVREVEVDNSIE